MLSVNILNDTGIIYTNDHFIIITNGKLSPRYKSTVENIDSAIEALNQIKTVDNIGTKY